MTQLLHGILNILINRPIITKIDDWDVKPQPKQMKEVDVWRIVLYLSPALILSADIQYGYFTLQVLSRYLNWVRRKPAFCIYA